MMKKYCGMVALLGLPNAGKSSILNALIGQKIAAMSPKPQTTRRILRGILTSGDFQIVFVDTPGLMESAETKLHSFMQNQALAAIHDVSVVAWILDVAHVLSKNEHQLAARERLTRLFAVLPSEVPRILVLNKIDKIEDKSRLLPVIDEWSKIGGFSAIVPISAKNGQGLEQFTHTLSKLLPEHDFMFDPDSLTDASERDIVSELVREKALITLGEEIPHQIAVTIETFDEKRRNDKKKPLIEIAAVLHVERESQKKIVIGRSGQKIKSIGIAAREDIEALLGCQVMLKLFVRVEAGWSQSGRGLKKLGLS